MSLVPLGVIWVGYSMVWYGIKLLQGPGIGILDVISPSRIGKMDTSIQGTSATAIQAGRQSSYNQALQSMQPALPGAFVPRQ